MASPRLRVSVLGRRCVHHLLALVRRRYSKVSHRVRGAFKPRSRLYPPCVYFFTGPFAVHFFYFAEIMVFVKRGLKWSTVLVSSISRLKMDGSGGLRFGTVLFTVPGKVCGLETVSSHTPTVPIPRICRLYVAHAMTSPLRQLEDLQAPRVSILPLPCS